jgi:hypothetical protein
VRSLGISALQGGEVQVVLRVMAWRVSLHALRIAVSGLDDDTGEHYEY